MWGIEPRRLLQEAAAVKAAGLRMRLVHHAVLGPVWAGTLCHAGGESLVEVLYPWGFPHIAPSLREFNPRTRQPRNQHRTGHQLPDGSLCLFTMGQGAESWRPAYTVVDVVKAWQAFKKLQKKGTLSTQRFSRDEQVATYQGPPAYLPASMAAAMRQGLSGRVAWAVHHGLWVARAAWRRSGEALDAPGEGWETLGAATHELPWCTFAGDLEKLTAAPKNLRRLLDKQLPAGQVQAVLAGTCPVLVVGPDTLHLAQVAQEGEVRRIDTWPVFEGSLESAIFARVDGAMAGRAGLADRLVVLVGLGTLGSHIALALARAGVRRFHLFDPDVLVPENISRHIGTLRDLGRSKVEVVADHIRACHPGAEVYTTAGSVLPDMTQASAFGVFGFTLDTLLCPDALVIVSVANHHVENALNGLLLERGVAAIYASVVGPGDHGRVLRVVPGETGCLECLRHAQAAGRAASLGWAAEPTGAYHQPSVPGLGLDVQQVALIAARLALQTLSRGLEGGMADEPANHLLWTNRGWHPFDRPLQLISERVEPESTCQTCQPHPVPTPEEVAQVSALLLA